MTVVKGPGERFYDVPQHILEQYSLEERKVKRLRAKAVKMSVDDLEEQDVEGYSSFLYDYEGFGYICGLPPKIS